MSNETPTQVRTFRGEVVSDKGNKTLVVKVVRFVMHAKYKRQYKVSRTYHVHDEQNAFHEGDMVEFVATRPMSKTKRWRVTRKVTQ